MCPLFGGFTVLLDERKFSCTVGAWIFSYYYPVDISTTVFSYSRAVQYRVILHGAGVIARALGLCGILATTMLELMHSNGELLGILCGKRQDAALVWIINILLHLVACISRLLHSWAAFSLAYDSWKYHAHLCNNSRYCMLTRVIRYIYQLVLCNFVQLFMPYLNLDYTDCNLYCCKYGKWYWPTSCNWDDPSWVKSTSSFFFQWYLSKAHYSTYLLQWYSAWLARVIWDNVNDNRILFCMVILSTMISSLL